MQDVTVTSVIIAGLERPGFCRMHSEIISPDFHTYDYSLLPFEQIFSIALIKHLQESQKFGDDLLFHFDGISRFHLSNRTSVILKFLSLPKEDTLTFMFSLLNSFHTNLYMNYGIGLSDVQTVKSSSMVVSTSNTVFQPKPLQTMSLNILLKLPAIDDVIRDCGLVAVGFEYLNGENPPENGSLLT
jgi:hypothetical protein